MPDSTISQTTSIPDFAVFVNTSDGFQDCWEAFFELWKTYSQGLQDTPIYLNTERAIYRSDGLDILCTQVWSDNEIERPSWSTCLIRGLDRIPQPYVLYLQEDYFLKKPVDYNQIAKAVEFLKNEPNFSAVYLNRYGPQFRKPLALVGQYVEVPRSARYFLSTQAAVWKRAQLRDLARPWENGWMFEKFGSWRSLRGRVRCVSVPHQRENDASVIEYVYTGVMKGKWHQECPRLFAEHGLDVDFGQRGFYRDAGRLKTKFEVLKKLVAEPLPALRSIASVISARPPR